MSTGIHTADTTDRRKRRRGVVFIKFGLAGAALLGIAAAATSAAWTDDAWFNASATAATVHLQASLDGTTWVDAKTSGTAVTIPLALLNQSTNVTQTLYVKNVGTVPLTLGTPVVTTTGGVFTGADPATATLGALSSTSLAAGSAAATAVLTIKTDATWPVTYQGTTGTVTVHFPATS